MDKIQIFKHPEFGNVRTITINDEPWFIGKDVADNLGYQNGSRDVNRHVDEEDRKKTMIFDGNQDKETIIINESGLYSLVLSSKLPTAKQFKRWVTSEVLPTIRKHGAYATGETIEHILSDPDSAIKLLKELKNERDKRREAEAINEANKPKVIFADAVSTAKTTILIGDLAKILRGNGIETGQKRLFKWMRDNGYLIKEGRSDTNMPTQRAVEMGLFEIKESSYIDGSGANHITKTTKVTGKGQEYFINKLLTSGKGKGMNK